MQTREQTLRTRAQAAGQAHLFDHYAELEPRARESFLDEVESIDFELVAHFAKLLSAKDPQGGGEIRPPDVFALRRDARAEERAKRAHAAGEELLRQGRVGYVLVAGGQASRLGYDGPKGAYRIGPVTDRSLFGWHASRLLAARNRYGRPVPWYVMTSPANDAPTRAFFAEHDWFGLDRGDVFFFSQEMVPALDFEGRILFSGPGRLFLSPNGHGGTLLALERSGALADARRRGVEQLSYFQVDNPLAPPADPLFLGLHLLASAGMSSKVVAKRNAAEKVGVIGLVDGRTSCIEYSDLPADAREARDARGELLYGAGNIAMHVLDVGFVESLTTGGLKLPWHVARKSMNVWERGVATQKQGAKFETFVFDALPKSASSVTLEVARTHEFSPVKNASGEDSPATCRADLCRLHAEWVAARGLPLPEPTGDGVHPVEIDPVLADHREAFLRAPAPKPRVDDKGHVYV
ncbi:MAG: UTP--glucose-1-phosphate uridylyltransferase [Planctomycetes bacterium]|nr:UTP--glucose-1-phosphate uridylyltransferase [Planctomycetota bacterium]